MWSYRKHSDVSSFCLRYVRFPWELNLDRYFTQNSNGMLDTVIVSSEKKSRCRLQEELITYVFLNMIAKSTSNAVDKRLSYQISQSETLFMILLFCQSRIMILSWDMHIRPILGLSLLSDLFWIWFNILASSISPWLSVLFVLFRGFSVLQKTEYWLMFLALQKYVSTEIKIRWTNGSYHLLF